jgi:hypothetical protein
MPSKLHLGSRMFVVLLFLSGGAAIRAFAANATTGAMAPMQDAAPGGQLNVSVLDEIGHPLSGAVVVVQQNGKTVSQAKTAASGGAVLTHLAPGAYKIQVEKQGFYTATVERLEIVSGQASPVEVRLQQKKEFHEEVEVKAQPSIIDPEQSAGTQQLTAENISTIPYPSTRDYRNVLPYLPGVIVLGGQAHVAGSSTQSVQNYVDGFEVGAPASGSLTLRVNPDALRSINVRNTRYSAQYGKGSGGLIDLDMADGDNKFRYNATDFVPTLQNVKGINFNNWTPRAYVSGPLVRDKAWFDLSHEGENDLIIVPELPDGADRTRVWRTADMARLRMNVAPGNTLTVTGVTNLFSSEHAGIDSFDSMAVAFNQKQELYLLTVKDQITLAPNTLLEIGTAYHLTHNFTVPSGTGNGGPEIQTPEIRIGSFYQTNQNVSNRAQAFSNLFLRPWKHLGTHQVTMGGRVDRVLYHGLIFRQPYEFVDDSSTLLRKVFFGNAPRFSFNTMESGAFIQDRWSAMQRLVVEVGGRWDRDSFVGRDYFSPRAAMSLMVDRKSETKISAGVGVYYDRTNLNQVSLAAQGIRIDEYFSPTVLNIPVNFVVDPNRLTLPRFINWSAGIERRLPGKVYVRVDLLSRRGTHGWAYEAQPNGDYLLDTKRQDRHESAQITVRKEFKRGYPLLVSYTRARSTSNETVDFSMDNFTTGNQVGGVLPWDSPNQIVSWGSTPLPGFWKFRKFDLAYSVLWRTGFPFFTVDQFGRLASGPDQFRFPDFLSINPAIERKFVFKGYLWAGRVGIDNITNSQNPTFVDNVITSGSFLAMGGFSHRTFNGRIRFLGKKPN